MVIKYEQEIRALSSLIVYEEGEIISVDEMIRRAKEKKRENKEVQMRRYQTNQYNHSHGLFLQR